MRNIRRKSSREGMTLLETVIAVTIFWICIAGVCGVFVVAKELADRARDHYTATNIAKNRLERAGSFDYGAISVLAESNVVVDMSGTPVSDGAYRRTTEIVAVPSQTNLMEVIVTVEIMNRFTLGFTGEKEVVRTYLTEY